MKGNCMDDHKRSGPSFADDVVGAAPRSHTLDDNLVAALQDNRIVRDSIDLVQLVI